MQSEDKANGLDERGCLMFHLGRPAFGLLSACGTQPAIASLLPGAPAHTFFVPMKMDAGRPHTTGDETTECQKGEVTAADNSNSAKSCQLRTVSTLDAEGTQFQSGYPSSTRYISQGLG